MDNIDNSISNIENGIQSKSKNKGYRRGTMHLVKYSDGIVDKICSYVTQGKSIHQICAMKSMPSVHTWYNWCDEYPTLKQKYKIARERKAHLLVEKAEQVPEDALKEVRGMDKMDKRCNAIVQAHRLKADVNLKIAGLYNKKEYGDNKQDVSLPAAIGVQIVLGECVPEVRDVQAEVSTPLTSNS